MAVNYLNNRDMLAEIHKSKVTYCSYLTDEDRDYDLILPSVDKINIRTVAQAKRERAKSLSIITGLCRHDMVCKNPRNKTEKRAGRQRRPADSHPRQGRSARLINRRPGDCTGGS